MLWRYQSRYTGGLEGSWRASCLQFTCESEGHGVWCQSRMVAETHGHTSSGRQMDRHTSSGRQIFFCLSLPVLGSTPTFSVCLPSLAEALCRRSRHAQRCASIKSTSPRRLPILPLVLFQLLTYFSEDRIRLSKLGCNLIPLNFPTQIAPQP